MLRSYIFSKTLYPHFLYESALLLMAMIAVQPYLIASFNLLLASRRGDEQLSSAQIVAVLCQMVEGEELRSFQQEILALSARTNEYNLHRL